MHMLGHHHITDQTKSRRIAHLSQFFHEEVSCPRRFQKGQSPVTTESNKVQIAFAVIAFKTRRHRQPHRRNNHPKTQVPTPNLGHPPSLYTSPRRAAVISSPRLKCQRISNFRSGPPARGDLFLRPSHKSAARYRARTIFHSVVRTCRTCFPSDSRIHLLLPYNLLTR